MTHFPLAMDRRTAVGLITLAFGQMATGAGAADLSSRRPAPADRRFTSPAVEEELKRVANLIRDPELVWLFTNCYPNTLDTAVDHGMLDGAPDTFVITGDIPAMWLRDSSAQLAVYLPLARRAPELQVLFRGIIQRHARSVLLDPYANAFCRDPGAGTPLSWAKDDLTEMRPGVAERKWEIDSLCHILRLAHGYWRATGDSTPFDRTWREAAATIIKTMREQQRLHDNGPYRFQRVTETPTDTLALDGYGMPTRKVGLIHSMFRPSDDACTYPFLVPSNLFAVTSLRQLAEIADRACGNTALAIQAATLANEIAQALQRYAVIGKGSQAIWAYEVDGFGNTLFMDDANVPSLSSIAYLGGADRDDALFRRTEQKCWSTDNPYFFTGRFGEGIGSPHVGVGKIWPMSLIIRALSSNQDHTIMRCLRVLKNSHAGTGFMHEAFLADDPARFTRPWFAWANAVFAELIIDLVARKPALLA